MSVENKIARFMRNSGPARFFVPLGIILIVFGILLLTLMGGDRLEATATVLSVTESRDLNDNTVYDTALSYTVDGKIYTKNFDFSKQYAVGESISVYYNPDDPENVSDSKNNTLFGVIMIGVGVLALAYGVFATVKAFKKSKALDSAVPASGEKVDFEGFKTASDVTEYYFRFDGHSLKPGYIVEDADRKILFEGKMLKQALVGARTFQFHNHLTGSAKEHAIGHTVTQSYNDELFSAKSWFKFDGKNVWDLLHEKGIRISTNMHSKFPYFIYEISKDGAAFARVESTGVYVHEDEEAEHKLIVPTGRMYYRIWTNSNDLDLLFLTVFAISETEQTVVE